MSKLSSTLHGPGGGGKQLPVLDLTPLVPHCIRPQKRLAGFRGYMTLSSLNTCRPIHVQGSQEDLPLASHAATGADGMMQCVHAVAQVLHELAEHRPKLSQTLFHSLIE